MRRRLIASHADIGAYEFVPNGPAVSGAPTSPLTATVNGMIDPNSVWN